MLKKMSATHVNEHDWVTLTRSGLIELAAHPPPLKLALSGAEKCSNSREAAPSNTVRRKSRKQHISWHV